MQSAQIKKCLQSAGELHTLATPFNSVRALIVEAPDDVVHHAADICNDLQKILQQHAPQPRLEQVCNTWNKHKMYGVHTLKSDKIREWPPFPSLMKWHTPVGQAERHFLLM